MRTVTPMAAAATLLLSVQSALGACRAQGTGSGFGADTGLREALAEPVAELGRVVKQVHAAGTLKPLDAAAIERVREAFASFGVAVGAELERLAAREKAAG